MGFSAMSHDGWFKANAAIEFDPIPGLAWEAVAGDHTVLVLYSSSKRSPLTFDRNVTNDELVLELPSNSVRAETTIDVANCVARYQRGSTRLTYASRSVSGELTVTSFDGARLTGKVHIVSSEPETDLLAAGEVKQELTFDVKLKRQ